MNPTYAATVGQQILVSNRPFIPFIAFMLFLYFNFLREFVFHISQPTLLQTQTATQPSLPFIPSCSSLSLKMKKCCKLYCPEGNNVVVVDVASETVMCSPLSTLKSVDHRSSHASQPATRRCQTHVRRLCAELGVCPRGWGLRDSGLG